MEKVNETSSRRLAPTSDSNHPAISVIIALYNAEKYISECLDSVLYQTFQNFEVIVVDDCSTDSSREIVESYIPKFDGRLRLAKTEVNSGGGAEPRNIAVKIANGEYISFVDADDFILLTALETLYNAAKEYNADVVYTGAYFNLKSPTNSVLYRDGEGKKLLKDGLEDKPDLRINDQEKNLRHLLLEEGEGNFRNPWTKFLRRDFLLKNKIFFPKIPIGEDFIWIVNVYCHAKRFLRLSTPFYFYRTHDVASVTKIEREPHQQISYWISTFVDFVNSLRSLENENKILSDNLAYCFEAFKSNFKYCLLRTNYARKELSDEEIYETLYRKFDERSSDSIVPFFFSFIDSERKISDSRLQVINNSKKEIAKLKKSLSSPSTKMNNILPKDSSTRPFVSVIIALYNAEKYIGECLDSLLAQTLQNFEVIVVDDCSTDNSVEIVESFASKFNGRLTLAKMDKNSGGASLPRNKAIVISCGEYLQNLDADDMLTKTALEELYTLAKDYDADVVYCEKYYRTDEDGTNLQERMIQKEPVKVPTFEPKDFEERIERMLKGFVLPHACLKFVRRKLMVENEIFYPNINPSEDDVWTYALVTYAKNFLHVPNAIYINRLSENSSMRTERTSEQKINFWMGSLFFGLKSLDRLISKHKFFDVNPSVRYAILKKFIDGRVYRLVLNSSELTEDLIYSTIENEFGERLGEYDVLIPALCAVLCKEKRACADEKKARNYDNQVIRKFASYFTARLDAKMIPKDGDGDFQIISVSDEKAKVTKPAWFQKGGIGYMITSYVGKLEIVTKATTDGQIQLTFRGMDVRDTNDNSKRIPQWIDYTAFAINGQMILDALPPVWHDAPYRHNVEVKADEEITLQFEWQPHRIGTTTAGDLTSYKPSAKIDKPTENKTAIANKKVNVEAERSSKKISDSTTIKDLSKSTARLDAKMIPKDGDGDFQIISVSDDKVKVTKPAWFQKGGVGYMITSYVGKLEIVTKATADGQIQLNFRGMDVRDPNDKSKRIPQWIDYTKFAVNGKMIFDKFTPVWHDAPYRHNIEVKAGEEITLQFEWQPHTTDTKTAEETTNYQQSEKTTTPVEEKPVVAVKKVDTEAEKPTKKTTTIVTEKVVSTVEKLDDKQQQSSEKISSLQNPNSNLQRQLPQVESAPVQKNKSEKHDIAYTQTIQKFALYLTARIDLKLISKTGSGDLQILSLSDDEAKVSKIGSLNKDGVSYAITSYAGNLKIVAKAITSGQVQIRLRGRDVRDPKNKTKRIPHWIDYTALVVNGQTILDTLTPTWHNKPYQHNVEVKAGEEITLQVEWLPHSGNN